jgi:hypothetical protein
MLGNTAVRFMRKGSAMAGTFAKPAARQAARRDVSIEFRCKAQRSCQAHNRDSGHIRYPGRD